MSFFSGSRCCISPALAEKQRCYVFFHRSINDHHPVFFSWNAALVLVYSLSCDMNFRGSGILTNTLEWWIKRSRMAAVSALSWWYPPQKITSSDIIITTKWHRNYHRMTDKLPEGKFLCFPSESAVLADKTTGRCLSYFIILLVLRTDKDITNDWQRGYHTLTPSLPCKDDLITREWHEVTFGMSKLFPGILDF